MESISATAKVLDVRGETLGFANTVDSLHTLLSIFDAHSDDLDRNACGPPPQKKQRNSLAGSSVATPLVETTSFDANSMITLAHVSLELDFSTETVTENIINEVPMDTLPVYLQAVQPCGSTNAYRLELSFRTNDEAIQLECSCNQWSQILPHLERAVVVSTFNRTVASTKSATALAFFQLQRLPGIGKQFRLTARLAWKAGVSLARLSRSAYSRLRFEHSLWNHYVAPVELDTIDTSWSVQDFYEAVHTPSKSIREDSALKNLTRSELFPFQNRTVQWALKREGQSASTDRVEDERTSLPVSFRRSVDAVGSPCYISTLRNMIVTDPNSVPDGGRYLRGGLLAEEMGLGKTLEILTLINAHPRKPSDQTADCSKSAVLVHDADTNSNVWEGEGTLVITPQSILDQWLTELEMHTPNLKVCHYKGVSSLKTSDPSNEEVILDLLDYDVVVTTYAVLAREIHYAKPPPERSMRGERKYERRKSPLVQIQWWRVCLDEAQMVESGVSAAATVARLIPRINAWAISGTPLRKNVQDLFGLLIFLRYEPFCSTKKLWERAGKTILKEVFGKIALRHTKAEVSDELRLPLQLRYVIMQPFTAIEEQNYKDLVRQMCDEVGFSLEGAPLTDDFDPNSPATIEKMRQWLRRLRQTCVHPLVRGRNRRILGRSGRPLRTVDEVLEVMIDTNHVSLRNEERTRLNARIIQGHVVGNAKEFADRGERALAHYTYALGEANRIVDECTQELATELGKNVAIVESEDSSSEQQEEDERNPRTNHLRLALRSAREIQHVCNFFTATAYYNMKSDEATTPKESSKFHELEALETKYYDAAKQVRQLLLKTWRRRAEETMDTVRQKGAVPILREMEHPEDDYGGIENLKVHEAVNDVRNWLNKQSKLVHQWRAKVTDILIAPLVDEDPDGKEITGEEYESSTKMQDELYVYLTSLRALVADRSLMLSGQHNVLVEYEIKSAIQQAKWGEGHAPELLLSCMEARQPCVPAKNQVSFRSVISQARAISNSLSWQKDGGSQRAAAELQMVDSLMKKLTSMLSDHTQDLMELEKEMEMFRSCMNLRIEFYRRLQHISDMVKPWKEEMDESCDLKALTDSEKDETKSENRVASYKTKGRFLAHLRLDQKDESTRTCIICQDTYMHGVLTVCGHKFCKECITYWWQSHSHCPVCKQRISPWQCHDVTYRPKEIHAVEESQSSSQANQDSSEGNAKIYHKLGEQEVREINSIDLDSGGVSGYGTKIDNMIRHLIYMRSSEAGSKTIVFSQFTQFLETFATALERNRIGYTSITKTGGVTKFKQDPNMEVFLLDAKSDASGLNLINASNVFLSEPLVNPAIELQAIARVHRIGQTRTTKVFMYLIEGSVEESIYEMSVSRRLEHVSRQSKSHATDEVVVEDKDLDAANSEEMQKAQLSKLLAGGKQQGELVKEDDLWQCLFGKRTVKATDHPDFGKEMERHIRAEAAEGRMEIDLSLRSA